MYAAGFAVAIAEKFDLTVRTKNNTKLMKSIYRKVWWCIFQLLIIATVTSVITLTLISGDTTYDVHTWHPLWGAGVLRQGKNEILSDVGEWGRGVASVLDVQSLFFLLQKIGFAPWPDIMLSQTLIYYWQEIFLLTVRQWRHPFMIPFALFVG